MEQLIWKVMLSAAKFTEGDGQFLPGMYSYTLRYAFLSIVLILLKYLLFN